MNRFISEKCLYELFLQPKAAGALRTLVDHDDAVDDLAVAFEVIAELHGVHALAEAADENFV